MSDNRWRPRRNHGRDFTMNDATTFVGQAAPPAARRHANAGVRRLVDRRRATDAAGKQSSVANVAIARELACWCWAVGNMVEAG